MGVDSEIREQNAEDDAQREKLAREVVAGKHRNRRRGRGDNMDLDDDDESEDDGRHGSRNYLKKRKIDNDDLDELGKFNVYAHCDVWLTRDYREALVDSGVC